MRFMLESMALALQQAMDNRDSSQQKVAEMSRELEEEKDACKKVEKETADKYREIAALRKALADEQNKRPTCATHSEARAASLATRPEAVSTIPTVPRGRTTTTI